MAVLARVCHANRVLRVRASGLLWTQRASQIVENGRSLTRWRSLVLVLISCALCTLSACGHAPVSPPLVGLSATISELELHLRDDPYRSFGHIGSDGRNFFDVTRWRIERLQRERAIPLAQWGRDDFLLEFARARTLERLHRYRDASLAYQRVASGETPLADLAGNSVVTMGRFAGAMGGLTWQSSDTDRDTEIRQRAEVWTALASSESDPTYRALALSEAESWDVLGVITQAHREGPAKALVSCESLVDRNRGSKLHARHLILLGNLHTDVAMELVSRSRSEQQPLMSGDYEAHFRAAVSAYELAAESRIAAFRREAESRLQALFAYHEGVLDGVY